MLTCQYQCHVFLGFRGNNMLITIRMTMLKEIKWKKKHIWLSTVNDELKYFKESCKILHF